MNRVIACLLLLFLSPLLIIIAFLLAIMQGMPIFFLQERIGLHQKKFRIIKFRTMEDQEPTMIGNVLRKTGIDELPQLINIVRGEMNFIGPRPLTSKDIDRLQWSKAYHRVRWSTKPGLTGLAQLSPICNKKMSIYLDRYYVNHHHWFLDFKILLYSCLSLFIGKQRAKTYFYR